MERNAILMNLKNYSCKKKKKMTIFSKFIYRFNPISIKIQNGFYVNWQADTKIYMKM